MLAIRMKRIQAPRFDIIFENEGNHSFSAAHELSTSSKFLLIASIHALLCLLLWHQRPQSLANAASVKDGDNVV